MTCENGRLILKEMRTHGIVKSPHFLIDETIVISELEDELGYPIIIRHATLQRAPGFDDVLFSLIGCSGTVPRQYSAHKEEPNDSDTEPSAERLPDVVH